MNAGQRQSVENRRSKITYVGTDIQNYNITCSGGQAPNELEENLFSTGIHIRASPITTPQVQLCSDARKQSLPNRATKQSYAAMPNHFTHKLELR